MSDDAADQKSAEHSASQDDGPKASEKPRETVLGNNAGVHIAAASEEAKSVDIPADFGSFVVSLGTNCMINLGHIPHPDTQETVRDLSSARHTIELLEMLREKTRGNLSEDEAKLIKSLIYDLKAAYVQETQAKN